MTLWQFCSCLGPALPAICFAVEAASSPPDPPRPRGVALSQTTVIKSGSTVLKLRENSKPAQFRDDLLARAAVFSQSSSTVVVRNTTNVNSSVASPSLPHKSSSQSGSGRVAILLKSTAMNFGATNGSFSISATSTMFSTTSSSTAVEVDLDNSIASALSNITSTASSVASYTNSTGLTSSQVSAIGAAGANADRSTILTSSSRSASTGEVSTSDTIRISTTTSINPTNSAALADGIALGGALLLFSKSAAKVGSDIVKLPTKTTFLKSLETIESNLVKAFKDRGGVDTGGPCVAKAKRFRFRKRSLLSLVQNAFRCAIDSTDAFISHLNMEDPDPTVLADDLEAVGTWAKELEADEENDDDGTTTTSDPTSQRTTTTTSSPASQPTTSTISNPKLQRTTTTTSNITSQRITSRSSVSRTATISSGQLSNATCYTGSMYPFPASPTAHDAADGRSVVFSLLGFALSSFFAMDPPVPLTTASLNSTWAKKTSITIVSLPSSAIKPVSMTMASIPSSAIKPASMTIASIPSSAIKPASTTRAPLPSSAIDPAYIQIAIATPVPGQNGIAQCVYEIVSEQQGFPAGTENGCFCAGGPEVSAAWAPLLTHSPTSSGASSVTDCAYTTQPKPGWTPSITTTSTSTTALEHTTRSPLVTTSPLPELACIQIIYELQGGKNAKQVNTCTCNDGSKPTATVSDHTFVCPSQVSVIVGG